MTKRSRWALFLATSLAACATTPTAPTSTPSASPAPIASTAGTASAATTSSTGEPTPTPSAPPPSGFYHYALRVVSDDCTPALQPFEEKSVMVFAHTTPKGVVLNVPLVMQNGSAIARSDVDATPGATRRHVTKNGACAADDVHHTLITKDASRALVVLDETSEHLDRSACAPPGPPACASHVEIRLTLQEAKCEASCGATVDMTKKPPEMVCKCP